MLPNTQCALCGKGCDHCEMTQMYVVRMRDQKRQLINCHTRCAYKRVLKEKKDDALHYAKLFRELQEADIKTRDRLTVVEGKYKKIVDRCNTYLAAYILVKMNK